MISITKTVVTMGLLLVPSTLAVALEPRNTGDPIWFTMKIWSTNVNTKVIPTKHIDTTVPDSQTGFESYQGSSPEPVFQIPQGQTDKQYIVGQLNFFMMPSEPRGVALLDVPGLDDPSKQVQVSVCSACMRRERRTERLILDRE